jgi:hypothetical protein
MTISSRKPIDRADLALRVGDMVIAVRTIGENEEGYEPRILAKPGDVGQVVGLGDLSWPTIRFSSGVTDCVPDSEVVRWSAHDYTVSRAVARG